MIRRALVHTLAVVCVAAFGFAQQTSHVSPTRSADRPERGAPPQERKFTFTYAFTVRNPEPGRRLRVWFPRAHSDKYQKVELVSAKGDLPLKQTKESAYGDEMFYAETQSADKAEYHFETVYEVTRYERLGFEEIKAGTAAHLTQAQLKRYLQPDKLVPVTGKPAEIAAKEVRGKTTELAKARGIYDYVFATMRYDKTGTGWGQGDSLWACESKRGNCTDFHSLFASMARSQGIPTRFEIGFPLPADKHEAEIPGYHCWSDFYLEGKGWIPVDISEAWKHQEKKDYFFGAHDVNRIQFTTDRDLTLSPKQDGSPLNYFIYPYAESNGKEVQNIRNEFSFRDESQTVKQASAN